MKTGILGDTRWTELLQYKDEMKWSYVSGIQCAAAVQNVTNNKFCTIKHTTDPGTSTTFSIPLNTQHPLPYTNPGIAHHYEFSAMVNDHFLITDSFKAGWFALCTLPAAHAVLLMYNIIMGIPHYVNYNNTQNLLL